MVAQIIGVGQPLLDPDVLEERAQTIERELYEYGIEVTSYIAVGTDAKQMRTAVAAALKEASMLIVLGGLGITPDDFTKDIVCETLQYQLVLHGQTLHRVQEAYSRAGRPMPPQAKKLAMMPEQSVVFPGVQGITPGCAISTDGQFILMLPDSSEELLSMLRHSVLAYLSKFSHSAVLTRTVNVFGMHPDVVSQKLYQLMQNKNPAIEVVAGSGEVSVRVTARGTTKAMTGVLCSSTIQQIMKELGDAAYGTDQPGLSAATVQMLEKHQMTVSVCECATGGLFSAMLSDENESLLGYRTAPRFADGKAHPLRPVRGTMKKYGGISPQAAVSMANNAIKQRKSDFGVGITGSFGSSRDEEKGQAGTYYIAVCDKENLWIRKLELPKNMPVDEMQSTAALTAFFLIARQLGALPGVADGGVLLSAALAGRFPAGIVPHKKRGLFPVLFPTKGDSSGVVARKLAVLAAVFVFIGSASYLGTYYYQSFSNRKLNAELAGMYVSAPANLPAEYPQAYQPKFATLYAVNEDIAGWVRIDGTQVNYPVVQSEDNNYYMRRDLYKKNNRHGVPWMEFRDSLSPPSDNYIIYGHNMADGQMFGHLMQYKSLEFLQAHPTITFDDIYRDGEYVVFAVYLANTQEEHGEIFYYNMKTDFESEEDFEEFIGEVKQRSYFSSDLDVEYGDQFLTLSTCSYEFEDARTVVMARRIREGEKAPKVSYSLNDSIKYPDVWYTLGAKKQAAQAPFSLSGPAVAAIAAVPPESTRSADEAEAARASSEAEAERLASEEAARASSEEAARLASEEAARASSEEAERLASEEAARASSEEAARLAAEAAARASSEEAARLAAEEAARASSEEAARLAAEEAARASSSQAALSSSSSGGITVPSKPSNPPAGSGSSSSGGSHGVWADTLTIVANGKKITGTAAEIVAQVVMNETSGNFHSEALKAQALAAYTFIRQQNAAGISPYLGVKTPNAACVNAVNAVEGEAIYYNGSFAFTPFYATSAGVTTASKDVWGGHYDYLVSVDSSVDEDAPGFKRTVTISADEVNRKVSNYFDIDLYSYNSNPAKWFTIREYADDGVYIKSIQVGKKTTTGRILRENVLNLRSAAFDVSYSSTTNSFTFTTYGYGHGVGLSQNGANLYAQQGWSYEEILEHYYPGTYVE